MKLVLVGGLVERVGRIQKGIPGMQGMGAGGGQGEEELA
jgi:hypothetical protein